MSTLFKKTGQLDSAIHYAQMVAHSTNPLIEIKNLLEAVNNLTEIYKQKGNKDSAFRYIELSHNLKDSLFSKEKDREVQNIAFNEQLKHQEILSAQARYKSRIQIYALVTGLFVLVLIAAILWRNNLQKQKAKIKIENAYATLKATQAQLIQSEKMASLGELTAGIAHEIQNPLNFVNNFSEVNTELIAELEQEANKGNIDEVKAIANDIKENEQKINHHGKRADAIVKGMLQHSRATTAQKEPTDINALADEYLRLTYHGLRAKDKTFNAKIQTDFDKSIGLVNIIPQDIGRVLLNLFTNAFYAVKEKNTSTNSASSDYEPTVSVSTKNLDGNVEIRVKDNGTGIPQKVLDKIYQPFFTTKPTGQGTGLGLSLSYDIIKAHGGEIKVETKDGEGAEFIVQLPIS
jgi:signal transduction histidine kinase